MAPPHFVSQWLPTYIFYLFVKQNNFYMSALSLIVAMFVQKFRDKN